MTDTQHTARAIAGLAVGVTASALKTGAAKLTTLHRETVEGMPRGDAQEVRVLFAHLDPGDRTPRHTHRFPVTVYMLEGTFTLELEGREPVQVRAGETFVEPAGTAMVGWNKDAATPARMALFYVCEPDTPFADPAG